MTFSGLAARVAAVREEIAAVQSREGVRQPVTIVAITKGHPPEAVRAAWAVGLTVVGENRVQEAVVKRESCEGVAIDWHLVGHLQTNKARLVPHAFTMVHSVDSAKVIEALDRECGKAEAELDVLIQVNVAGEGQKSGCQPGETATLVGDVLARRRLRIRGLMTMAPLTVDEALQRRTFAALRTLRDDLATASVPLADLSMGMSADWRAAVAEGATLLRLGTILFGDRP